MQNRVLSKEENHDFKCECVFNFMRNKYPYRFNVDIE